MNEFIQDLQKLPCEVRSDAISKQLYSVDASIYEVQPTAIVIPRSKDDLIQAVRIAKKYKVSVTMRGAATGITGGCLGTGLVIDTSHLNNVISVDYEKQRAVVEPGTIQDHLNEYVRDKNLRLGPDTSTGNRATIGGMVANNACGAHALKYGRMVDAVEEVEVFLALVNLFVFMSYLFKSGTKN